jgi:prepilin-type N-terminal cleavage/methylation domain-containing protein
MRKKSNRGFSLLEILITMAIIAILTTVMMKFYTGSSGMTPTETLKTGQGALDQAKELQKASAGARTPT